MYGDIHYLRTTLYQKEQPLTGCSFSFAPVSLYDREVCDLHKKG